MQKLTLWGRESSGNVQKVLWALRELDLPFEHIEVGGKFGGLDAPEYESMNPNKLVPVLRHGDLTLWESSAIVRYLAAEFGAGTLWPQSNSARAVADQWADWSISTFQPAWIGLFWALVRTPPSKRDAKLVSEVQAKTDKAFTILDGQLAHTAYVAGDQLTYADILNGVAMYRWSTLDIARPELPNVARWHARLMERAAFVQSVCISYEELVAREAP